MASFAGLLLLTIAAVSALPTEQIIAKYESERYQYIIGADGPILADLWLKASDLEDIARYNPDLQNQYHLFTRVNPSVSQPIVVGNEAILAQSNYDASKRTVLLIHGWLGSATTDFNVVVVPAFLAAADVNIIVVDWSAGAGTINYIAAITNTATSGASVGRFINWLNSASGSTPDQYHLAGFSLGGQQVGIVGRNVSGSIDYISALDPAGPGWGTNNDKFREDDGAYTEVIHTSASGYLATLGHTDFYPNGGINMPGCVTQACAHNRAYFYFAESLTSGGFTGRRCSSYEDALVGDCHLSGDLQMGGLTAKTGSSGVFHLITNANSPFSQG